MSGGADGVDVAKRRKKRERARKQAFPQKQLQQPLGAGPEEAVAHRGHHDRAGVDQQLGALGAGKVLFAERVEAVAIGACRESQQTALDLVTLPRQQQGVLSQELLQALDVIVVNDAPGLRCCPFQPPAEALTHFSGEVLPAGVAVLTRDHELCVALRQGRVDTRQMHARTGDRGRVTGGNVARELLCLFSEGLERRTIRERLRSGHSALFHEIACTPLKPG